MKKIVITTSLFILILAMFYHYGRAIWHPVKLKVMGRVTVEEVIATFGENARNNIQPSFADKGVSYPPQQLALVAFKDTDLLEIWAANKQQPFQLISTYSIQAASGELGPKLREGDRQVPEGIYKIEGFNPNSAYHLSMKLNYPNEFDLKYARQEGRTEPGTNIFIHGKAFSVGCLAMGDEAIEELITLVHDTGRKNTQVLIAPRNPGMTALTPPEGAPQWTGELYQLINIKYRHITSTAPVEALKLPQ